MGDVVRIYGVGGASLDGVEYKPEADGALVVPVSAIPLLLSVGGTLTPPAPAPAPVVEESAPEAPARVVEEPKPEPEPKPRAKGRIIGEGLAEGVLAGEGRRKR